MTGRESKSRFAIWALGAVLLAAATAVPAGWCPVSGAPARHADLTGIGEAGGPAATCQGAAAGTGRIDHAMPTAGRCALMQPALALPAPPTVAPAPAAPVAPDVPGDGDGAEGMPAAPGAVGPARYLVTARLRL